MGLTPTEGLMMGTRVGDVDPGALTYLMERRDIGYKELQKIINKESGVLGVSRHIQRHARHRGWNRSRQRTRHPGHGHVQYHILKYIGAYTAVLGESRRDRIHRRCGREPDLYTRNHLQKSLAYLGVTFNAEANKVRGSEIEISGPDSKIRVVVIPTDEELMIATNLQPKS